jgi:hypothetical protein
MTRPEFEELAQALVGRRIARVQYYEIDHPFFPPGPVWDLDERFDSLNFGLALTMKDGDMFFITWGDEFVLYNISIIANPQIDGSQLRWWDVTEASRWKRLKGQQIEAVRVVWAWELSQGQGQAELRDHPSDIDLIFPSDQHVYLSNIQIVDDDWPESRVGHVTVIFDREVAEEFGVGLESFDPEDPSHLRQEAEFFLDREDHRVALEFLRLAETKSKDREEQRELQERITRVETELAGLE